MQYPASIWSADARSIGDEGGVAVAGVTGETGVLYLRAVFRRSSSASKRCLKLGIVRGPLSDALFEHPMEASMPERRLEMT